MMLPSISRPISSFGCILLGLQPILAASTTASNWTLLALDTNQWSQVITRDVCVIGGGGSGTHAAVQLIGMNKTVAVVEQNDYLGGHTFTYNDPNSNATVDIGVVIFQPFPNTVDYFAKFDIPIVNATVGELSTSAANEFIDFRTGETVVPDAQLLAGEADALRRFAVVMQNFSYLLTGYDLPDPVPEDLVMPYGMFLEKYNLTSLMPIVGMFSQGQGDIVNLPAIYAMKYFSSQNVIDLSTAFLASARSNTSELYTKAAQFIGDQNIFFQSSVVTTNRVLNSTTTGRAEIIISTVDSGLQLLSCGQILLTIPPTTGNLIGWDLTTEERAVFSQFDSWNGYWTGLATNIGLNFSTTYSNAAATSIFGQPVLPALYKLTPTDVIQDVWNIKYGATTPVLTDDQVRAAVIAEINTVQRSQNITVTEPEFLIFHSHTPYQLTVSPDAIRNGFYRNLTSLQGTNSMWYSGAAFHFHDCGFLWRFNDDVVLPSLLKGA